VFLIEIRHIGIANLGNMKPTDTVTWILSHMQFYRTNSFMLWTSSCSLNHSPFFP